MRLSIFLSGFAFLIGGCTSAPKATTAQPDRHESAAYKAALNHAFDELDHRDQMRSPAGEDEAQTFAKNFKKTQHFDVVVTPKLMKIAPQPDGGGNKVVQGDTERFRFRIDRQGHCALAGDLVSDEDRAQCVQVEIKPINSQIPGKQFVRIFMNASYQVYGISYHDYDADNNRVKRARRLVQWDPSEPLSSELLSLAKEVVPLDLPIYASNRLTKEQGEVDLKAPRDNEHCDGWNYHYKNTFGSWVKAGWCSTDPWPTVVETNRYIAVLVPAGN